jgi:hypothetical protein
MTENGEFVKGSLGQAASALATFQSTLSFAKVMPPAGTNA